MIGFNDGHGGSVVLLFYVHVCFGGDLSKLFVEIYGCVCAMCVSAGLCASQTS